MNHVEPDSFVAPCHANRCSHEAPMPQTAGEVRWHYK